MREELTSLLLTSLLIYISVLDWCLTTKKKKKPRIANGKKLSQVSLEVTSSANLSLLLCETDSKASVLEDKGRRFNLVWFVIGHALLESSHQV